MLQWFKNILSSDEKKNLQSLLEVDFHSHLLPGLDDGAASMQDSLQMISEMKNIGYRKIVTTPHVMGDFYQNDRQTILNTCKNVKEACQTAGIEIDLSAAAEYYLDESFLQKLQQQEELLTFGNQYVLFETSYVNESRHLNNAIFQLKTAGYRPILAHPERYTYLYRKFSDVEDIFERGVLFQININSLAGYYSPAAKKFAEKLIEQKMVHALCSDCHTLKHLTVLKEAMRNKYFHKALQLPLINFSL